MKLLFVSSKVERCIAALEKAGKSGKNLAQKATGIIESLASGRARHHMDAIGSYTKYGENRIKNCHKYDLGCGYRLITLQRDDTVFIPFLGTHDKCQRWLEGNRRLKDFGAAAGRTIRVVEKKPGDCMSRMKESVDDIADDRDVFKPITDKDLRLIFSGLVQGYSNHQRYD